MADNSNTKALADVLGFDPAKSENERVQKAIKDHQERKQQLDDFWAKRQQELAATKPISEKHQAHETKLERNVVERAGQLDTHQTAAKIAQEMGMGDKAKALNERVAVLAETHEQAKKVLHNYRDTQQVQQRIEAVQDKSEPWKHVVQSHGKFANEGVLKANDEFLARNKPDQQSPAAAKHAAPQNQQAAKSPEQSVERPDYQAAMQHASEKQAEAHVGLYQRRGEIAGNHVPMRGNNYASDLAQAAWERRVEHTKIMDNLNERLMTDDDIAKIEDPEERERLKAGQATGTERERLILVRDLAEKQYEATTARNAANICLHVGGADNLQASEKMAARADEFEKLRSEAVKKLHAFDEKNMTFTKAEGQFRAASNKAESAEQGVATQKPVEAAPATQAKTEPQATAQKAQGESKMIKTAEMEAPKNPAAARMMARVQAKESAGAKEEIGPGVKERFAQNTARSEAFKQAQQEKLSERQSTQHKPIRA